MVRVHISSSIFLIFLYFIKLILNIHILSSVRVSYEANPIARINIGKVSFCKTTVKLKLSFFIMQLSVSLGLV